MRSVNGTDCAAWPTCVQIRHPNRLSNSKCCICLTGILHYST